MSIRSSKLFGPMSACALSLALALAGCGSGASANKTSQDTTSNQEVEQVDDSTSQDTSQAVEIPEALSDAVTITKEIVAEGESADSQEFEELPELTDESAQILKDSGSEVEVGLSDADKASTGTVLLTSGGVQMQVPASWFVAQDEDGYVLTDPSKAITGYFYSIPKQRGTSYDIESMLQALPISAMKDGLQNVQLGAYNTYYSSNETLCDATIFYSGEYEGQEYAFFTEIVESKSYINIAQFSGTMEDFANNANDIAAMSGTVAFNSGEQI